MDVLNPPFLTQYTVRHERRDSNDGGIHTRNQVLCKIVQNKIVFCTLHKQAEKLLAVCNYLQKFIRDVKLKSAIDGATKKCQDA